MIFVALLHDVSVVYLIVRLTLIPEFVWFVDSPVALERAIPSIAALSIGGDRSDTRGVGSTDA